MIILFLLRFVDLLFTFLNLAIIGRVILSWFNFDPYHPISRLLYDLTEPILAPIRRFLPTFGLLDLSPMVAIFLLLFIRQVLEQLIIAGLG